MFKNRDLTRVIVISTVLIALTAVTATAAIGIPGFSILDSITTFFGGTAATTDNRAQKLDLLYPRASELVNYGRNAYAPNAMFTLGTCDTAGPIEVESTGGTAAGVPTAYATLSGAAGTGAFATINAGVVHTGTIVIEVCGDTNEGSATATVKAGTVAPASWTSLTMKPVGGAARTISGATTAGNSLILMDGVDNMVIDGLNTGGNSLTISNTQASATANTSTIRYNDGATGNTITKTTILGSFSGGTGVVGGTIFFSTDGVTTDGNDGNIISNNNIGPAGATLPTTAIYGLGSTSTTAINNSGIQITGNKIYDFFGPGVADSGIFVSSGNTDWTITGNSFYQTATRTATAGSNHIGINISNTSGNNFVVSNNFIGGGAINAGGSAWTVAGTFTNRFRGISLSVGNTTASSVQGNTIANFAFTSSSGSTANGGPWTGIYLTGGNANIGTTTGNTIGSGTGTGSISITMTTSGNVSSGIFTDATSTVSSISNNTIGSVALTSTSISGGFTGIVATAGTTLTISGNTIGSTSTANSISTAAYTGTTAQVLTGINNSSSATISITGNTIANLNNGYLPAAANTSRILTGIVTSAGVNTVSGNTVRNLTTAANATGTGSSAINGLQVTGSTAGQLVSANTVHSISATHASVAVQINGIYWSTSSTGHIIERNFIHSLSSSSTGLATITGIYNFNGSSTYRNNMIRLGIDAAGSSLTSASITYNGFLSDPVGTNNYYFNSIFIGGTSVATGSASTAGFRRVTGADVTDFRNNIVVNNRSNSTGTGKHYAIALISGSTTFTSDKNVFNGTGTGFVFGIITATDSTTFANWKTNSSQDTNSLFSDPLFIAPTGTSSTVDLHIGSTSPARDIATNLSITNDYDGQTRPGANATFDIGADEQDGVTPAVNDIQATAFIDPAAAGSKGTGGFSPQASFTNNGTAAQTNVTVRYRICTDGTCSSVLYNQTATIASIASLATTTVTFPATGALSSGTYTIKAKAELGTDTVPANDEITSTVTILAPLAGDYTVGSGGNYATLTAAVAALNSLGVSAPVRFLLTDATYSGSETFPLTINAVTGASSTNTVTIRPNTGVTAAISGASASGPVIKLNGASYVTIDGSNSGGTDRSLTITNTSATTPSAVFFGSVGTTPITNDTLKNCVVINGVNTSSAVLVQDTAGSTAGYFNNITIQNNSVQKAFRGIFVDSVVTGTNGSGTLITQNLLNTSGTNSIRLNPIFVRGTNGVTVSNNTLGNISDANAEVPVGIVLSTGTNNFSVTGNTISSIISTDTTSSGSASGILISTGGTPASATVSNNTISTINSAGTSVSHYCIGVLSTPSVTVSGNSVTGMAQTGAASSWGVVVSSSSNSIVSGNTISTMTSTASVPFGINVQGTSASVDVTQNTISNLSSSSSTTGIAGILLSGSGDGVTVRRNNVNGISNSNTSTYGAKGIRVAGTGNNHIIRNNFVSNVSMNMTGGAAFDTSFGVHGLIVEAGTGHQVYNNSVNLYGLLSGTSNSSILTSACSIAATTSTGIDFRNNICANNITGGTTSIAHVSLFLPSGATSAMNLTLNNNALLSGTDTARQGIAQVGTTAGTGFYLASNFNAGSTTPASNLRNYTSTLLTANTNNDNASKVSTAAVPFTSSTDLHIKNGAADPVAIVARAGVSIGSVTTDYDGDTRKATPDIGADEFTTYTLNYAAGANGSLTGTASQIVNPGGSGSAVTAVPNGGYQFVSWTPGGSTANPRTDSNVAGDISVTANFALAPPTVTSISPTSGTTAGGTSVTITGTNLTGATGVTIGGNAATSVVVVNDTSITAVTPAGTAGTASVLVTTPGGTNTANSLYTYVVPQFALSVTRAGTGVGTVTSSPAGISCGTTCTANYNSGTVVTLTATPNGTSVFTGWSGTAGCTGNSTCVVTVDATKTATATFNSIPTVTGLNPTSGSTLGTNTVTITGTNLTGTSAVTFGTDPGTSVVVVNDTTVTVVAPAHAAGVVDVIVTTPGGNSANTAADDYTYVVPNTAPVAQAASASVTNGNTVNIQLTGTDADGNALTFATDTAPAHGTVSYGAVSCSGNPSTCTTTAKYRSTDTFTGDDTFTFRVNDGTVNSPSALVTVTISAAACTVPPTGMVAWYRGQGNTNDAFGNHASSYNGGFVASRVGQGFDFGGSAGMNIPHQAYQNITASGFTVDLWMKSSGAVPAGHVLLAEKAHVNGTGWAIQKELNNGRVHFITGIGSNSYAAAVSTTDVFDGNWHHIGGTYDGTSELKIYIDGVLENTVTGVTPVGNSLLMRVGYFDDGGGSGPQRYFTGQIDEIELFNVALSGPQIAALYNAGSAGKCAAAPTVTTPTSSSITSTSAVLGGTAASDGGTPITERGVVYSETAVNNDPLIGGVGVTKVTAGTGTGVFTTPVSPLLPATGYSFKAYATNSVSTTYTTPVSTFTTVVAAPATPSITSSTPASPSTNASPTINGTALALSTVNLYTDSSCSSTVLGTGSASAGGAFNIGVTVPTNTTTTIYASATNAGGTSGCSSGFAYTHDNTPPNAPVITGSTPASPSSDTNPTIQGTNEAGSTVKLYLGATCGGSLLGTAPATGGTFGIAITVLANTTTIVSATATDAAGNVSPCSSQFQYTNDQNNPDTSIDFGAPGTPTNPTSSTSATFTFGGTDTLARGESLSAALSFECALDTLTFTACQSSTTQSYTGLSVASHTFMVRARDAAGNVDDTPASFTWQIVVPTVNLSVSTNSANEATPTVVTVTATASIPVTGAQTVTVGAAGTNITAGDYTFSSMTITIPDGQSTGSVTFTVVDDSVYEGTETATLTISSPSSGVVLGSTTQQNITITDNDAAPTLSISDVTDTEGNGPGTKNFVFTVTRTGETELTAGANFDTKGFADGGGRTAIEGVCTTPGDDFLGVGGNFGILPGGPTGTTTITVQVCPDTVLEPDETFTVDLTSASDATFSDAQGLGTIVNDDTACTPPPAGMTAWYDGSGTGSTVENIAGSPDASLNTAAFGTGKVGSGLVFDGNDSVTAVNSPVWDIYNGSFTIDAWVNFNSAGGNQTIISHNDGPGNQNKWVFALVGATLELHRNDPVNGPISLTVPFSPTVGEWYHVAVTRSGSTFTFYIDGAAAGTRTDGSTPVPDASAPLAIGSSEGGFYFNGVIDEVEIFSRALTPAEIGNIYNAGSAGKCHTSNAQFNNATGSVGEGGGTINLVVTRDGANDSSATVNYTFNSGGTDTATRGAACTAGVDYIGENDQFNFGSGVSSITFPVTICDDAVFEGNETFSLTLSNPTGSMGLGSPVTETVTIVENDAANTPPNVAADNPTVSANEGSPASNTGTYSDADAGDNVVITASVGSITKTGTNSGTWSWSFTPADGPNQSQTVTITANDGVNPVVTTTFGLTVNNVAPTIALTGNSTVAVNSSYSLGLGSIVDPGTDLVTSYSIDWGDGVVEPFLGVPSGTKTHTYTAQGIKNIAVSLTDEDGTFPNAGTKSVTVGCQTDPVVTANSNSGAGSLRQAVIDACVGSNITFSGVTSPISLSTGQIVIDRNLTITGPGASSLTVSNTQAQGATSRVFLINSGVTATISGITVSGGNTSNTNEGGGIRSSGNLTMNNAVISGNTTAASYGGGIYVAAGLTDLNGVTISNNTAPNGAGMAVGGGTLDLDAGTVQNNIASGTGGGFYNLGGILLINNTLVGGSSVGQRNTGILGGGGVVGTGTSTTITGGAFVKNAAIGISGNPNAFGGGIYAPGGTLSITGTNIEQNSATPFGSNTSRGGFLYRNGPSIVTISLSRIVGNTATTSGGAIENANSTAMIPPTSPINGTVLAENNWWGCDGFPNSAGCDVVNNGSNNATDSNPRIDLRLSASPTTIVPGGTSTLTADVIKNTDGNNVNGGNAPDVLVGRTLTFAGDSHGTVNAPLAVTIPASGVATKTFTANSDGTACGSTAPSVQLDNGNQPASITVQCADLTMTKTNNVSGNALFGQPWTWTLTIVNGGSTNAVFGTGQTLVTDDLPNGADMSYGTPTTATNATCSINGTKTLSCVANAGGVTIAPAGSITVQFTATPTAAGAQTNPRAGGVAQADPLGVIVESNESNNAASDTVTVGTAPTFAIDDVTLMEGNSSTTAFTFTVTKTGSTSVSATVDYATVNGSAAAPADFTAITTTTLTFLPSETSKQFTVFVNGDTTLETDENFIARLSNPVNSTITRADGIGTILNDECTTAPTDMVGWYRGEGDASDAMGLADGSLLNGATANTPGKVGNGFAFDGNDDRVSAPNLPSNQFSAATPFSLDAWVNFNVAPANNETNIVTKWGTTFGQLGYSLRVDGPSGKLAFVLDYYGVTRNLLLGATTPAANTWYHVTGTYDGTSLRIYVNGVLENTMAMSATAPNPSSATLDIGNSPGNPDQGIVPRRIDEVEIFNRALSLGDIQSIYNASGGGKCLDREIAVEQPVGTNLTHNVSTVDWGGQPVGVGAARTFTIRNVGAAPLTVSGVTTATGNAGDFVVNTSGMTSPLNPGQTTTFTVTFNPSAGGARTTKLNIANDDADENPFILTLSGNGDVCTAPPVGMTGWYPGEGNANDIAGPNNGNLLNGAAANAAGKVGSAFGFDGVDDRVSIPNVAANQFIDSTAFSIDAWVNFGATPGTNEAGIVTKWGTSFHQLGYSLREINSKFAFILDQYQGPRTTVFGTTTVVPNTWYHVTGTYDGVNVLLYVNGVQEGSASRVVTGSTASSSPLDIGNSPGNPDSGTTMPRRIDEVELFSRALTLTEIQNIFTANTAGKCHTSTIQFSSAAYSVTEGNVNAPITVTRVGAHDTPATFDFATSAGSATAGAAADYDAVSLTGVTFAVGEVSKTINIQIHDDAIYEVAETVNLSLSNIATAPATTPGIPVAAVLTINPDADAAPVLDIGDFTFTGANSLVGTGFPVSLTGASEVFPVTVHYQTSDNTAIAGSDYTAARGTLTFNSSGTTQFINVPILPDTVNEPEETFFMDLDTPVNATINDGHAIGTIPNDDPSPTFTINNVSQFETNSGTTDFVFTVTKTGQTTQQFTVNYTTATTGSAIGGAACGAGIDYENQSGSLVFAPSDTTKTITIKVCGDTLFEPDETFGIELSGPPPVVFGSTPRGTILNDDCTPPPAGMAAWYSAENNANDLVGGNDATLIGSPGYTAGKVGQAFNFNGTSQFAQVDPATALATEPQFSADGWFYWRGHVNATSHDGLIVKMKDGVTDAFSTFIATTDNSILGIVDGNTFSSASGIVPTNQWFHLAQTYDGTTARIYLNGTEVASFAYAGPLVSNGAFYIGNRGGNGHFFNGLVDEVEVFNRALTAGEIANLATASGGGKCHTPIVQFAKATYMEDESQTAAVDVSRSVDTSGTTTVTAATVAGGTATGGASCSTAGVDYVTTSQMLTFGTGVTTQPLNIQICPDTSYEGPETIKLLLTSPSSPAVLGSQTMATLTINDTATQFRDTRAINIPSGGPAVLYPSTITVSGAPTVNGGMRVTLYDITHSSPDGIDVLLVGPQGQKMVIMGDAGGTNPMNAPVTLTFDDSAGVVLPDNGPLTSGKFEPTTWESVVTPFPAPAPGFPYAVPGSSVGGTPSLASAFGAGNPNGDWKLYVRDDAGMPFTEVGLVGSIAGGWGLQFVAPTAAGVSVSGRVTTAEGRGIRGAIVTVTGNSLATPINVPTGVNGRYIVEGLTAGETYVITIRSRRFTFSNPSRIVTVNDSVNDADFVADPGTTRRNE